MNANSTHESDSAARTLFPALDETVAQLLASMDEIRDERKAMLDQAAAYIADHERRGEPAKLIFICTHNSRRSHMSQIWAQTAAWLSGIRSFESYSGGTEATAFHPNALRALSDCGFRAETPADERNPLTVITFAESAPPMDTWSKRFDDPRNPQDAFAAIMTCSDADEACPIVPGADARFPVRYEDPKHSDGSDEERAVYSARCREIGREMLFMMRQVSRSA